MESWFKCRTLIYSARVCGLAYSRRCFRETFEIVSEKGIFQWRGRLLQLLSNLHAEVLYNVEIIFDEEVI